MKVSFYSLSQYLNLEGFKDPEWLASRLSMAGLEVEEWEDYSAAFDNVVVGLVKQKKPHPRSDHLQLCRVEASASGELVSIVCGANNFEPGDKVALALPRKGVNVTLKEDGSKDFLKMQTRNIRGELSQGMLLAFNELFPAAPKDSQKEVQKEAASPEEDPGIMILHKAAPVGSRFADLYKVNDILWKLNVTPNRPDCLSHFGVAGELACLLGKEMKKPSQGSHVLSEFKSLEGGIAEHFTSLNKIQKKAINMQVEVRQKSFCSRYTGAVLQGVCIQASPLWLQIRLVHLGIKPINNVVDISNYLMLQRGQPLHAFDLDYLLRHAAEDTPLLAVDLAHKGEQLKTLDGVARELEGTELCIRDGHGPVALAGVIGGMDSAIQPETKNIFIESAVFDPGIVRKMAKKFNIETDSAYRFSRGVPAIFTREVLQESVQCMQWVAGGSLDKTQYDIGFQKSKPHTINISISDVERRVGYKPDFHKFCQWMKRLSCNISPAKDKQSVQVEVPPPRQQDLCIKEDLIEEYARLEGYDKIPEKIIYAYPRQNTPRYTARSRIVDILVKEGFYEAINHDFISREFSNSFFSADAVDMPSAGSHPGEKKSAPAADKNFKNIESKKELQKVRALAYTESYKQHLFSLGVMEDKPVSIRNPLSAEYNMMRVSLLPSLFKNALHSYRHGSLYGRLFELAPVFFASRAGGKPAYQEREQLAFVAWGGKADLWTTDKSLCVYDLKGVMTVLLERMGQDFEWEQTKKAPYFMHPGQFVLLKIEGKNAGYAGTLHPGYAEKYKIRQDMALAEWDLSVFKEKDKVSFRAFSRFPQMERDMAFWVPHSIPAGRLIEDFKKEAGPLCHSIKIFDVYQKPGEKERSIAFRLNWRAKEKTLTEKDIAILQNKITKALMQKWPIRPR